MLKAGDNKIVAGLINRALSPVVQKHGSKVQRGFIAGRQLIQNAVDLDFEARKLAMIDLSSPGNDFNRKLSGPFGSPTAPKSPAPTPRRKSSLLCKTKWHNSGDPLGSVSSVLGTSLALKVVHCGAPSGPGTPLGTTARAFVSRRGALGVPSGGLNCATWSYTAHSSRFCRFLELKWTLG